MKCPVCVEPQLVMTDRQGIEIDYCPQCRGVWLDRGELDKMIERSATMTQPRASSAGMTTQPLNYPQERPRQDDHDRDYDYRNRPRQDEHDRDYDYRKKKKRGGFLDDLFDFD